MTRVSDFDRLATTLCETYRLRSTVGSGGTADVYVADDLRTGRCVAIKALREDRTTPASVRRFLTEISVTAQMRHPNIVPLSDSGAADGLPYYVMPFVEGQSLREHLQQMGRLPTDEALRICSEIAAALDYAHSLHVVHCDVKPENVILHAGRALVFDFGIALPLDEIDPERVGARTSLGTPAYVSPEQARGDGPVDGRSDVYSLACMAYEMFCGYPPFIGSSPSVVLRRHQTDIALPLYCRLPNISHGLSNAVYRALSKRPADRFATPGAFIAAMRAGIPVADAAELPEHSELRPGTMVRGPRDSAYALYETTLY